jgi:hypothetical protein
MPPRKSARLPAPLKKFIVPIVTWCPTSQEFQFFQKERRNTYAASEKFSLRGREWFRIMAHNFQGDELGWVLLPPKYYQLWRRLVYGGLFQEKMFEAWIGRTDKLSGRSLNPVEEEMIRLRNMTGVRLVQYLIYRCVVLEELMKLRFENNDPVIHSLIEFGIRESRDWMFESFEDVKKKVHHTFVWTLLTLRMRRSLVSPRVPNIFCSDSNSSSKRIP